MHFPSNLEEDRWYTLLPLLFDIVLEGLARAIRLEKESVLVLQRKKSKLPFGDEWCVQQKILNHQISVSTDKNQMATGARGFKGVSQDGTLFSWNKEILLFGAKGMGLEVLYLEL